MHLCTTGCNSNCNCRVFFFGINFEEHICIYILVYDHIVTKCSITGLLPENAALRHKATQSSRYDTWYSEYAVDGVRGSCSHTNTQTDPWWRVDLINIYRVNRVAITNRLSYYSDIVSRINGAVIRVGNFLDVYSNPMWGYFSHVSLATAEN